ncbi:type II toxin-antitoxin system BrnA family antitoxin [Desulfogranum marinum]|uniref:type II toxin-antitoxin system BrnA family antitoxin n=1 Tax=Desulfogranum marinum TaxID=453220 RepID=UPI001964AC86|nr:hypothetical protein [Desulfogranum marinum]MBM9512735.1 hypothetical protein [Desulfogranum marinum]
MKAKKFDEKFESGEDLTNDLDFSKARRVNQEPKRVNIDFPTWVVEDLDKHSKRLGISRQALVKVWIAEKLKEAV